MEFLINILLIIFINVGILYWISKIIQKPLKDKEK